MLLKQIQDRIENLNGEIGIYYYDLRREESCFAGNTDLFAASGVARIPLLLELFCRIEEGTLKKDDVHVLSPKDYSFLSHEKPVPSYGVLNHLHTGLELTIEDLYHLMISVSDNIAFNILLELAGPEAVNRTMDRLGFSSLRINRFFFEEEKIAAGIDNYYSVREMGEVFRRLYGGQLISGKADREILRVLTTHQKTNILPYYFEEDLPIAHQTGFDTSIRHDVGIVLGANPFILCMGSSHVNTQKTESAMRDVVLLCGRHSGEQE